MINSKNPKNARKINELISKEKEDEQAIEDQRVKGLIQIDMEYVLQMANKKKSNWGGIWKAIKLIDKDQNGFVTYDELEGIFKDYFP